MEATHNDLHLLKQYMKSRDAEAFSEIVGRYQNLVYSVSLRVLGNVSDAEDASQKCFLQLAQKAETVTDSLAGWLHCCATRIAIDIRRQQASRKRIETAYSERRAPATQDEIAWHEMEARIDQALETLPDEYREILVRHFFQRATQTEIASQLGLSPATVSRRMEAGVELLRDKLKQSGVMASAGVLAALLAQNGIQAAPPTLTASLGKMAISGIGGMGTGVVAAAQMGSGYVPIAGAAAATAGGAAAPLVTEIYMVCAIVGGTVFLCQLLLSLLGLGHDHDVHLEIAHDADHDAHGDGEHGASFLSKLTLRAIIAALTFFGLSGLAATQGGLNPVLSCAIALAAGIAAMAAVMMLMNMLSKLQSDGTVHIEQTIGLTGKVYLGIPAKKNGMGKVLLNVQDRTMEYLAVSSGDELLTGTEIVVVDVVGPGTLEVASLSPSSAPDSRPRDVKPPEQSGHSDHARELSPGALVLQRRKISSQAD